MEANKVRFFTQDELRRLLDTAVKNSPRNHAMILMCYRHGLRASEICDVRMDDLDFSTGAILCRRRKKSVTNWQQMTEDELVAVRTWLEIRPDSDSAHLFLSDAGKPIGRKQFFRIVRKLGAEARIPLEKCHPHSLKHTTGTFLANAGVPVQVIQHRLGHKSIKNTMVYLAIASAFVDRTYQEALDSGRIV